MYKFLRNLTLMAAVSIIGLSAIADPLIDAIASDNREEKNVLRDVYRNPYETLSFFGIRDDMTVLESWPGGGWYSEILAPYLKNDGTLIAATYNRDPKTQKKWQGRTNKNYDDKFVANKKIYGNIDVVSFAPETGEAIAKPGSVDLVLDFRNAHNWLKSASDSVPAAWHKALRKGGIVGIVDHRMDADKTYNPDNGYIHEQQLIEVMSNHGFKLIDKSEINSNSRDTKDHPSGVWTLPPTLAKKAEHKNKYLAMGESDRLVMKFEKI